MTPADIHARTASLIALQRTDPDAAAIGAQELRDEALAAIAEGAPDAREIAAAAMRTIEQDVGGR